MDAEVVAAVVGGYLLGSIDFGVLVPRIRGVDIYSTGSGNPGASNVLRTMGRGTAVVVMLGDLLKGLVAAALGDLAGGAAAASAAGAAAVLGHCYPVWHRFRGGRGVAAAGGLAIWLEPVLGLALLVVWVGTAAATRRASVASLLVVASFVPLLALFGHRGWPLVWSGLASLLVIVRHHDNIRRILTGTEHRIGERQT